MNDREFLKWYQESTAKTAVYPQDEEGLAYLTLKLSGEVGELSDEIFNESSFNRGNVLAECGDIFWYISELHTKMSEYVTQTSDALPITNYMGDHDGLEKRLQQCVDNANEIANNKMFDSLFVGIMTAMQEALHMDEIMGKFLRRGHFKSEEEILQLFEHVSSVWWATHMVIHYFAGDWREVMQDNIDKLTQRKESGELKDRKSSPSDEEE